VMAKLDQQPARASDKPTIAEALALHHPTQFRLLPQKFRETWEALLAGGFPEAKIIEEITFWPRDQLKPWNLSDVVTGAGQPVDEIEQEVRRYKRAHGIVDGQEGEGQT